MKLPATYCNRRTLSLFNNTGNPEIRNVKPMPLSKNPEPSSIAKQGLAWENIFRITFLWRKQSVVKHIMRF